MVDGCVGACVQQTLTSTQGLFFWVFWLLSPDRWTDKSGAAASDATSHADSGSFWVRSPVEELTSNILPSGLRGRHLSWFTTTCVQAFLCLSFVPGDYVHRQSQEAGRHCSAGTGEQWRAIVSPATSVDLLKVKHTSSAIIITQDQFIIRETI